MVSAKKASCMHPVCPGKYGLLIAALRCNSGLVTFLVAMIKNNLKRKGFESAIYQGGKAKDRKPSELN